MSTPYHSHIAICRSAPTPVTLLYRGVDFTPTYDRRNISALYLTLLMRIRVRDEDKGGPTKLVASRTHAETRGSSAVQPLERVFLPYSLALDFPFAVDDD